MDFDFIHGNLFIVFLRCLFVVTFPAILFSVLSIVHIFLFPFYLIIHIITSHFISSFILMHMHFIALFMRWCCILFYPFDVLGCYVDSPFLGWPGISCWLPFSILWSDLPLDVPGLVVDLLTTLFDILTFRLIYMLWLILIDRFIHPFIYMVLFSVTPVYVMVVLLVRG